MKRILFTAVVAVVLSACGSTPFTPKLAEPQTITERAAYVEAGAQGAIKTLADLTCRKYTKDGQCTEAARPLHPARAQSYLEIASKARSAARVAVTMSAAGGSCLGQQMTPLACLREAETLLGDVDRILKDFRK